MAQRGFASLVSLLGLSLLLASTPALLAEDATSPTACGASTPALCSDLLIAPPAQSPAEPGAQPAAVCPCLDGNSTSCWGSGTSCSAAYSAFASDCHAQASNLCYPDAKCKVVIQSWSCQASGGGYIVDGSASFGCRYCF
ncbi:MAG TPA: hypothetical protein VF017_02790 [Thermoanaerobaculia bacterium]|nr:hypothetical protein [Thermoanaerobaculia bacterium]